MALTSDQIIDRRRLRRKVTFWRLAAVILILMLIIIAAGRMGPPIFAPHITTLNITGTIVEDKQWDDQLKKIAENDSSKALILLIDSPGGTTVGSENLFQGIRHVAEKKPVVAVIGSLGASGAYIAALAADHIVAHETSLTGSIGVIMRSTEISGLLDKIGVEVTNIKSGPFKAEPSETEPMSGEVKAYLDDLIKDAYQWFMRLVEERRGLSADDVAKLADGRIFTGRQARDLGLVDAIGGEQEALDWLAEERHVDKSLPLVDLTPSRPLTLMDRLTSSISGKVLSTERLRLDGLLSLWQP